LAYRDSLVSIIKAGKVKEATVDQSVRRILRIKFHLGLFDDPYKNCDSEKEKTKLFLPEYLKASREIARKSIVLLKNTNNILPLKSNVNTIAVLGPLVNSKNDMLGNWACQGESQKVVSLLEGIKAAVSPSTNVLYSKGCNILGDSTNMFKDAVALARQADVVVMAIGEAANMSGEAHSRGDIRIPGKQEDLVREVLKTGKPVVIVLMNGRPLTINWLAGNVTAILESWFLGSQGGNAIADVLFGKYNPSGKLPVSFPYSVGQIPVYYSHKNTGKPKFDDKYPYTSKYNDIPNEPLFPFGFGLSYTTFEYSDIKMSSDQMKMNDSITISLKVKNAGRFDGEEVVQLYIHDLVGSVTRPVKELKGFRKVMIKTGESQNISFIIKSSDLAFFTKDMSFKAEPGDFKVFVGTNSVDCKEAAFSLTK
jgi:beta-glucosidase